MDQLSVILKWLVEYHTNVTCCVSYACRPMSDNHHNELKDKCHKTIITNICCSIVWSIRHVGTGTQSFRETPAVCQVILGYSGTLEHVSREVHSKRFEQVARLSWLFRDIRTRQP